jgi:4a-hydroxytetrahydrobiopterin dehydratase
MEADMLGIHEQHCEACTPDSPQLTEAELKDIRPQLPKWEIVEENSIKKLRRRFDFADYAAALEFTNNIGKLAEQENHHPRMILEYGKVIVYWWTHAIKGLHKNDVIMASKTDIYYDAYIKRSPRSSNGDEAVERASKQSFPASDPPPHG